MYKGYEQRDGGISVEKIVLMQNISSVEHFLQEGEVPRRVLEDISIIIKRSEIWGITGGSAFEIKLMLEIMANIRSYSSGRCVLIERGMPMHKRIILSHVFYIGGSEMIYDNMNVLEFLMLAAGKLNDNKLELQEQIFEFIIDMGLGKISLTANSMLTKEEKAVVILIAASYSDSAMIIFNLPEYEFHEELVNSIAKISKFIRKTGKTLIMGTCSSLMIERSCSHTTFIAGGKLIYNGTVKNLRLNFDKVAVIVRDKNLRGIMEKLAVLLPGHKLSIKDGRLLIESLTEKNKKTGYIYKKILETGFVPEYIETNSKTVQNAYEELVLQYDLQK
ncbi:ABC-2 type transport system ATP-binding protein [Anaerobacterium chartisolvens]|uniref:ABC-2 type transport system ATP-binding protein n=1 Tax=Anaerobacterium chartisolvens TaxID=1297424 RepID=A0A369BHZ9_9FIRM|nr:hypothetical protein [Anaerobacterium chartisolvens]RCX20188.1 ABC-2 type transport system ATP-binding protein [Anaerobacterium chartisolvens]